MYIFASYCSIFQSHFFIIFLEIEGSFKKGGFNESGTLVDALYCFSTSGVATTIMHPIGLYRYSPPSILFAMCKKNFPFSFLISAPSLCLVCCTSTPWFGSCLCIMVQFHKKTKDLSSVSTSNSHKRSMIPMLVCLLNLI